MEFIIYLLKVNTAIMLFYCIYRMMFQKDTFFRWKRFALLSIIFVSFLYPAVDLTKQVVANNQLNSILITINVPAYTLPEIVITENTNTGINFFPQLFIAFYLLVTGLLIIRMLFQIGTIVYKIRKTNRKVLYGQTVYESPGLKTPFSFFRWIVMDSSPYSETELQEIILHETTHVKQGHSADTILSELVCAFCWFNPFAWILKREIRMNLEFLADKSVLSSGYGAEHYQFHLLRLSYHKAAATITNNFNVSLLKKRIFMMNKKQTPLKSIWKYALILPVIAVLLFLNSTFQTKAEPDNLMSIVQSDNETIIDQTDKEMNYDQQNPATNQDKPPVFTFVENPPSFPGKEEALFKWLKDNIIYPEPAAREKIQGVVNLRFVVTPDGSIEDVTVTKSLDPSCDREAVRVVKKMPKWIPGKQNGNPVHVYFNIPVRFSLTDGSNSTKTSTVQEKLATNAPKLVYTEVDEPPTFPGGESALFLYLKNNIIYPTLATEKGIQGVVSVRFVIDPDGSIEYVEIEKSVDPILDKEALHAVSKMPKWNPGKMNGKPAYVSYNLPVRFRLEVSNYTQPAIASSSTYNTKNEVVVTGYGVQRKDQGVIIEIDGKVVSDEEFNNLDIKTFESMYLNKNVNPNRIVIKTKK